MFDQIVARFNVFLFDGIGYNLTYPNNALNLNNIVFQNIQKIYDEMNKKNN
jgi:hypothetical protein